MPIEAPDPRRRYPRLRWVSAAECQYDGQVDAKPLRILDLSVGGLFVEALTPPEPGTLIHLQFSVAEGGDPITVSGQVCYTQSGIGMGIRFLNLKPKDQATIQILIDPLGTESPPIEPSLLERAGVLPVYAPLD